jgi:hypothetical protein
VCVHVVSSGGYQRTCSRTQANYSSALAPRTWS